MTIYILSLFLYHSCARHWPDHPEKDLCAHVLRAQKCRKRMKMGQISMEWTDDVLLQSLNSQFHTTTHSMYLPYSKIDLQKWILVEFDTHGSNCFHPCLLARSPLLPCCNWRIAVYVLACYCRQLLISERAWIHWQDCETQHPLAPCIHVHM